MRASRSRGGGRHRLAWPQRIGLALVGLVVVAAGGAWWWARPATPGPFYDPPTAVPSAAGALLRIEPFARGVPADARGWRLLYTTTRDAGTPVIASAIVVAPAQPAAGPLPVIAWAHGTTGVVPGCGPSLLDDYLVSGGMPALAEVVQRGWVLVATDYPGLGAAGPAPFLIGEGEGRAVLDAVRAARQIEGLTLERRAVVWGHSQGGHAALWTGALAPSYAPDLEIAGVAALAPATDLPTLVERAQPTVIGKLLSAFIARAYGEAYPDVRASEAVRSGARLLADDMAGRCLAGRETLVSVGEALALGGSVFSGAALAPGPLADRLRENVPRGPIAAPLLIGQGLTDELVLPDVQDRYVRERCAAGQRLEYRTYGGQDHMGLVTASDALEADLVAWTEDRLAGRPQPSGCQIASR
jgi:acetyl esterase/lipase